MNLKKGIIIHLVLTLLLAFLALWQGGIQQAVSAAAGSLIILTSVGLMVWALQRLMEQKTIALAGTVIVIKYALLGVILYWITQQPWARLAWLAGGVGNVVLTTLIYSITTKDEEERGTGTF